MSANGKFVLAENNSQITSLTNHYSMIEAKTQIPNDTQYLHLYIAIPDG